MVWSQSLVTEIVLPSNATPGAGSGAFVIVGPDNLPAELVALGNINSAIIWYTTGTDLATTFVKYQFIAYQAAGTHSGYMNLMEGYCTTTGAIKISQTWAAASDNAGDKLDILYLTPSIFDVAVALPGSSTISSEWKQTVTQLLLTYADTGSTNINQMQITDSGTNLTLQLIATSGTGAAQLQLVVDSAVNNNHGGYLTTNNINVDKWINNSISGSIAGTTFTHIFAYRLTFDRWVDFRSMVTFAALPNTGAMDFAITGVPLPDTTGTPALDSVYISYQVSNTRIGLPAFISSSGLHLRMPGVPAAGSLSWQGAGSYSIIKP